MLSSIICLVYFIANNQFLLNWIRINLVKIWFNFPTFIQVPVGSTRSCQTILQYSSYTCEYIKISQQQVMTSMSENWNNWFVAMIASLNIVAKTFAGLLVTIIVTRRRPVLILHLEAKLAKMDCKNEIYTKNWVRSTWLQKSQLCQKSTVNSTEVKVKFNAWKSQLP